MKMIEKIRSLFSHSFRSLHLSINLLTSFVKKKNKRKKEKKKTACSHYMRGINLWCGYKRKRRQTDTHFFFQCSIANENKQHFKWRTKSAQEFLKWFSKRENNIFGLFVLSSIKMYHFFWVLIVRWIDLV